MANWTSQQLIFQNIEDMERFKTAYHDDQLGHISLNKIMPIPQELIDLNSVNKTEGIFYNSNGYRPKIRSYIKLDNITNITNPDIIEILEENLNNLKPEMIEHLKVLKQTNFKEYIKMLNHTTPLNFEHYYEGLLLYRALTNTGYVEDYYWRYQNWGTKWEINEPFEDLNTLTIHISSANGDISQPILIAHQALDDMEMRLVCEYEGSDEGVIYYFEDGDVYDESFDIEYYDEDEDENEDE